MGVATSLRRRSNRNQLLHTRFMGMLKQSSEEIRSRAKCPSDTINYYHVSIDKDDVSHA